jgi:hypothetical protein
MNLLQKTVGTVNLMGDWCGPGSPTPIDRKQEARQSGITNSARALKKGNSKILTGTSAALYTCLLMGDPEEKIIVHPVISSPLGTGLSRKRASIRS